MQAVIGRRRHWRVLAVVPVARVGSTAIVRPDGDTRWDVLIDGDDQVQTAHVLIADADRSALTELLLDLDAPLPRIRVPHIGIHRRQVGQRHRCDRRGQDVREHGRTSLIRGQTDADLAQIGESGRVARRE